MNKERKQNITGMYLLDIDKGCFAPIVFSTTGGMGAEAQRFFKRLAEKIAKKKDTPYTKVISFVRRRVRFDLVKTVLIALGGFRGKVLHVPEKISNFDIHLEQRAF